MIEAPPSVAVTSTLAMVRTAEARGFPVADLLERAGLPREVLQDPDARIPGAQALELWRALGERTGDPALQLAAPTTLPFGAYRVMEYLVRVSATVGAGVTRFAEFFSLIADGLSVSIEPDEEGSCLCVCTAEGGAVPPMYVEYVFAALVGRIRMGIRSDLQVRQVDLRRPRPPDVTPYEQRFHAPVRFGAPRDRLCFTAAEWAMPIEGADEALARVLEEHARVLAARLPEAHTDFVSAVRTAVMATLPDSADVEHVARELHMSSRTLQRKLAEAGTTFREVLDHVLSGLAESYLADTTVSIREVGFLLGFSDQSSFHRAFVRWTGSAPGRWRRERIAYEAGA